MQEFYQIKFDRRFTSSLKLGHHPVSQTSFHFRNAYFQMLSYLLAEKLPNEITAQRLMQYRLCLMGIDTPDPSHNSRCSMRTAINHHIWIGKSNYVLYLLLDAALILDNPEDICHVSECIDLVQHKNHFLPADILIYPFQIIDLLFCSCLV